MASRAGRREYSRAFGRLPQLSEACRRSRPHDRSAPKPFSTPRAVHVYGCCDSVVRGTEGCVIRAPTHCLCAVRQMAAAGIWAVLEGTTSPSGRLAQVLGRLSRSRGWAGPGRAGQGRLNPMVSLITALNSCACCTVVGMAEQRRTSQVEGLAVVQEAASPSCVSGDRQAETAHRCRHTQTLTSQPRRV